MHFPLIPKQIIALKLSSMLQVTSIRDILCLLITQSISGSHVERIATKVPCLHNAAMIKHKAIIDSTKE